MEPEREHLFDLSVVATIYNDSALVQPLVEAIRESLSQLGDELRYEIILVDDASADDSAAAIAKLCRDHPEVRGLCLAHNVGQQQAISANEKTQ